MWYRLYARNVIINKIKIRTGIRNRKNTEIKWGRNRGGIK